MKYKELIRLLEKAGYVDAARGGQTGHRHFYHPGRPGVLVTVPMHSGEVPKSLFKDIMKQAQLDLPRK